MNSHDETMQSVLEALVEVTRALCASVEHEDFASATRQLDERESLLAKQSVLVAKHCAAKRPGADELRQLFDSLKQVDQELITLFGRKKAEISGKIELAQNQRRLLAYSR
ncbi:MAG: hypothetical protein HY961_16160 [Ignavibacteriae bacterium]|nr:hypothetical protein [Ignavibacteriota bacterium]